MQIDRALVAIRERGFLDILDLGLRVCRWKLGTLVSVAVIGILPAALLNHWLLSQVFDSSELLDAELPSEDLIVAWFTYLYLLTIVVLVEIPLATAPITLYLGQAMFSQRVDWRRLLLENLKSLPMILLQIVIRIALVPWLITCFLPVILWPYANEVILLERNPILARKNYGQLNTLARLSKLHAASGGELVVRGLGLVVLAPLLIGATWLTVWMVVSLLSESWSVTRAMATEGLQLAIWSTVFFFTVVRFLSYLDLRIRHEGWELELRLKAEAAHLVRQVA